MAGFSDRITRLDEVMAAHVDSGEVGGLAWLVAGGGEVVAGTAGVRTRGEDTLVERRSVFRIASMTKPIVATAALVLAERCTIRLDDPVDDLLPELAGRRVLVDPQGPIDGDTVAADRSITVRDLLTFELGLGMDFSAPWPQPLLVAMEELGLGWGPPDPQGSPGPDEWMRRLGTLPLVAQPGERWLYHVGSDVLGVLLARAAGQSLEVVLRDLVLGPLGMVDTGFTADPERLVTCYTADPGSGAPAVFDTPDGLWSAPPAFPSGGGGLVSTVDDMAAFGQMLLAGGRLADGSRLLSSGAVEAMTTDQVGAATRRAGVSPDGALGWGLGVGVRIRRTGPGSGVGAYGWDGGLGSSWENDPATGLVGVILTTDAFAAAHPAPAVIRDFWTTVHAALDD